MVSLSTSARFINLINIMNLLVTISECIRSHILLYLKVLMYLDVIIITGPVVNARIMWFTCSSVNNPSV